MPEPWLGGYPPEPVKRKLGRPRKEEKVLSEGDRVAGKSVNCVMLWQKCTNEKCGDAFYGFTRKPAKCYKCERRRF